MPRLFEPSCDPLIRLRRIRTTLSAASIALLGILAMWALWPLPQIDPGVRPATLMEAGNDRAGAVGDDGDDRGDHDAAPRRIDPEPFTLARLWNPPPPPTPEIEPERAEETRIIKRPELQLIGIIEEHGERFAALYHVERKELLIVRSGDRIEPFTVADITDEAVRLEDGRFIASWSLRKEPR